MSDAVLSMLARDLSAFSYEEAGHFSIRFFLRQLGVPDAESEEIIADGLDLFKQLPIDNRYYRNFAYNEKYLPVLDA